MKTLNDLVNEIVDDVRFHCKNCEVEITDDVETMVSTKVSDFFDEDMEFIPETKWYDTAYNIIYNKVCDVLEIKSAE